MRLRRVYTRHFPFKRFTALTLWPWVFIREDRRQYYTPATERHETTHALQQRELLVAGFLLLYGLEYVTKLVVCRLDRNRAYMSISFEQEAFGHQAEQAYNDGRRHWAWTRYVFSIYQL